MPKVKFAEVLSYSSQDPNHPATNLLQSDTFRKWKCAPNTSEKNSFVILKFDKLTSLNSIDIGNDGSALVEVLVSREGMSNYELLLVSSAFMSPAESRNETDLNRVRMFGPEKLNKNVAEQKWDRLKVICTQPFNTRMQYGLSFITAMSPENVKPESAEKVTCIGNFKLKAENDSEPISVGSIFAKRKEKSPLPLTEPAAIKAVSKELVAAASSGKILKRKDLPIGGSSSPLNKKAVKESISAPTSNDLPSSSPTTNQSKRKRTETPSKADYRRERTEDKTKPKDNKDREEREEKKRKNSNKESANSKPSSSKADQQETPKKRKSKPFTSLMDDVVFVMSGYQNPERSILRDKLIEMGAQYKPDWNPRCTHLICAFTNTPKYRQVKGKGTIVTKKWIQDCHKNKIRYPWRRYGLEKHKSNSESEEEVWAEELLPKVSKPSITPATPQKPTEDSDTEDFNYSDDTDTDDEIQKVLGKQQTNKCPVANGGKVSLSNNKDDSGEPSAERDKTLTPKTTDNNKEKVQHKKKTHSSENNMNCSTSNGLKDNSDEQIYDDDTDVDELPDTSSLPLPDLEDYFGGLCFFMYGNMTEDKKLLTRRIIAYNGEIEDYMSDKVNIVLTDEKWDENFEEALKDNSALEFVKSRWILECCDEEKLVPRDPFLILPEK